jgi:hypothetical protein
LLDEPQVTAESVLELGYADLFHLKLE